MQGRSRKENSVASEEVTHGKAAVGAESSTAKATTELDGAEGEEKESKEEVTKEEEDEDAIDNAIDGGDVASLLEADIGSGVGTNTTATGERKKRGVIRLLTAYSAEEVSS